MIAKIVPIGNSMGVRIPKAILEQCRITKEIVIEVDDGKIVIESAKKKPRKNWEQHFKRMRENRDDGLTADDMLDVDAVSWEW